MVAAVVRSDIQTVVAVVLGLAVGVVFWIVWFRWLLAARVGTVRLAIVRVDPSGALTRDDSSAGETEWEAFHTEDT
jgi:hypothetical protein